MDAPRVLARLRHVVEAHDLLAVDHEDADLPFLAGERPQEPRRDRPSWPRTRPSWRACLRVRPVHECEAPPHPPTRRPDRRGSPRRRASKLGAALHGQTDRALRHEVVVAGPARGPLAQRACSTHATGTRRVVRPARRGSEPASARSCLRPPLPGARRRARGLSRRPG